MIGVSANPSQEAVVREFFELFKTPWQFYQPGMKYDVVLCASEAEVEKCTAGLILAYGARELAFDRAGHSQIGRQSDGFVLDYDGLHIPIYGDYLVFEEELESPSKVASPKGMIWRQRANDRIIVRIGYDLFAEIRNLLESGQPELNAAIPTLDLHIALLRRLIVSNGIRLAEIPPVPNGYRFIACLTHDVDQPLLRQHRFDHTMFGYLYRATAGSLLKAMRGRMLWSDLYKNLIAALKLPLVHLGVAKDPWSEFDRYQKLEGGAPSSFFVIPFADRAGRNGDGPAPAARAACYRAADIKQQIHKLSAAGHEVGLHGIDAWRDSHAAREEVDEILGLTGQQEIGVRMHWLYFDQGSPAVLEQAGVSYDSTVGYNSTVGYRAGTSQVYKPLQVSRLLELPLHVMDTALFFPAYLDLSADEARERVVQILDRAVQYGGCVTLNWHDRSIAPERLWGDFYLVMIDELRRRGAWFATAAQTVGWFRKRRSASLENVCWESGGLPASVLVLKDNDLPDLQLRTHNRDESYQDIAIPSQSSMRIAGTTVEPDLDACISVSHQN